MTIASFSPNTATGLTFRECMRVFRNTSRQQWETALRASVLLGLIPNSSTHFFSDTGMEIQKTRFRLCPTPLHKLDSFWKIRIAYLSWAYHHRGLEALEVRLQQKILEVDLAKKPDFPSFLIPNEAGVPRILPLLSKAGKGLLVSTGTERSFFTLALIDPKKCTGLVVVDFNPEVKAYVDFNVLLLRICRDQEEYQQLSAVYHMNKKITSKELEARLVEIRRKVETNQNLPSWLKTYYLNNFESFASIYFKTRLGISQKGASSDTFDWQIMTVFSPVHYHKSEKLFGQLQAYARAGNIISVVGDMNELSYLNLLNIAVLDVSNIPDYKILHFDTKSQPLVISTKLLRTSLGYSVNIFLSEYRGWIHHPMTKEEIQNMDRQLEIFSKIHSYSTKQSMAKSIRNLIPPHIFVPRAYCPELLNFLVDYKNKFLFQVEGKILNCNYPAHLDIAKWMSDVLVQQKSDQKPVSLQCDDIARLVSIMVKTWRNLSPEEFFAFSHLPGWSEAFNEETSRMDVDNPRFNAYLRYKNLHLVQIDGKWRNFDYPSSLDIVYWMNELVSLQKMNGKPISFQSDDMARLVSIMVKTWRNLGEEVFLAFSSLPGWAEAFEKEAKICLGQEAYFMDYYTAWKGKLGSQ